MRVEAGRYDHQIGPPGAHQRQHHPVHRQRVLGVPAAGRQRHVHGVPASGAGAGLAGGAGRPRVPRVLVQRYVQHVGACVEDLLRAVAVVDVGIEDQHPAAAVVGHRRGRRRGGAVEQAEPHGARRLGVVAGRPGKADRAGRLAGEHGAHRLQRRLRREPRRIDAVRADAGVRVQNRAAAGHPQQALHVARRMRQGQPGRAGRLQPIDDPQPGGRRGADGIHGEAQPLGALGVAGARVVPGAPRVGEHQQRSRAPHPASSS